MSTAVSNYEELRDYSIEVRIRNARILGLMRRAGIHTAAELSRKTGVPQTSLGKLINLKTIPIRKNGQYLETVERIAEALFCHPDDMFTERQRSSFMASNRRCVEVAEAEVEMHLAAIQTVTPDEHVEMLERDDAIQKALAKLGPRERIVIEARFGLNDDGEQTLDQVSETLGVTRERVRQIELKALRKLKEGPAGKQLRQAVGADDDQEELDREAFVKHQERLIEFREREKARRLADEMERRERVKRQREFEAAIYRSPTVSELGIPVYRPMGDTIVYERLGDTRFLVTRRSDDVRR